MSEYQPLSDQELSDISAVDNRSSLSLLIQEGLRALVVQNWDPSMSLEVKMDFYRIIKGLHARLDAIQLGDDASQNLLRKMAEDFGE